LLFISCFSLIASTRHRLFTPFREFVSYEADRGFSAFDDYASAFELPPPRRHAAAPPPLTPPPEAFWLFDAAAPPTLRFTPPYAGFTPLRRVATPPCDTLIKSPAESMEDFF